MTRDRFLERGRKKQGRSNDSCHFFIIIFFLVLYIQSSFPKTKNLTIN